MQDTDFDCRIPNNVGLRDDPAALACMEEWHRGYTKWWPAMGPEGSTRPWSTCGPRSV
jgi:hypothetical protein